MSDDAMTIDAPGVDPAVAAIAQYEFGQSREALSVVQDLVRASLDSPDKRAALAERDEKRRIAAAMKHSR